MKNNKWWNKSIEETCKIFQTNNKNGLSSSQAKERLEKFGLNKLPEKKL